MENLARKIIELRDSLNAFLDNYSEHSNKYLSRIDNEQLALIKINQIIDVINLRYYREHDCLVEIMRILIK